MHAKFNENIEIEKSQVILLREILYTSLFHFQFYKKLSNSTK